MCSDSKRFFLGIAGRFDLLKSFLALFSLVQYSLVLSSFIVSYLILSTRIFKLFYFTNNYFNNINFLIFLSCNCAF